MGELILHIGTPKTGTTSLQKFLFDNRDTLLKNGVDFVQFTPQKEKLFASTYLRNGRFLSEYCKKIASHNPSRKQLDYFEENYQRLSKSLNGKQKILLSDENFYYYSCLPFKGISNPGHYWRELFRIVDELGAKNITLIVYLRRQDEYVVSQWKELIKNGYTAKSLKEFLNHPPVKCMLDYASNIKAIRDSFNNNANIIVRSYNQVAFSGTDIYHDFCESLGIEWDDDYKIPEIRLNESITFDMAEALRTCKYGGGVHFIEKKRVRNMLAVALSSKHKEPREITIFSPGEAEALMQQYSDGNRRISEEYCDKRSLFSEEYKERSIWKPNRLRIFMYRFAFLWPKLALKIYSGSKNEYTTGKKNEACNP